MDAVIFERTGIQRSLCVYDDAFCKGGVISAGEKYESKTEQEGGHGY